MTTIRPCDDRRQPPDVYRGPVRRVRAVASGGQWRVKQAVRVERMTLPPAWTPNAGELAGASYLEAIDRNGEVLYRRRLRDFADTSVEMFGRDGSITRTDTDRPACVELLVPDTEQVARLRLVSRGRDVPYAAEDDREQAEGHDQGDAS